MKKAAKSYDKQACAIRRAHNSMQHELAEQGIAMQSGIKRPGRMRLRKD